MRVRPHLLAFPCLTLALAAGHASIAAHGAAKRQAAERVSFCGLLAEPAVYSGRLVVTTVLIYMFKEGASLSSPECSKKAVWLFIQSKSGPGVPELSRLMSPHPYYARHPLIATLTGVLDLHYYDRILGQERAVFKVIAARDIHRSPKRELLH